MREHLVSLHLWNEAFPCLLLSFNLSLGSLTIIIQNCYFHDGNTAKLHPHTLLLVHQKGDLEEELLIWFPLVVIDDLYINLSMLTNKLQRLFLEASCIVHAYVKKERKISFFKGLTIA